MILCDGCQFVIYFILMLAIIGYCYFRIIRSRGWIRVKARLISVPREIYVSNILELLALSQGDKLLYEYEYNNMTYKSGSSTILPGIFRPFLGVEDNRRYFEEAYTREQDVWVYVDRNCPRRSALLLGVDILPLFAFFCIALLCLGVYILI